MAVQATTPSPVVSAASKTGTSSTTNSGTVANNFQQFLTLLTTQLQNQNPLDPLDTNQFTQQLVQFAQVEQQLVQNDRLSTLIQMQATTQATQALQFIGETVVFDGSSSAMKDSSVSWSLNVPKNATATINIMNSAGQTVYTETRNLGEGIRTFSWDGKGTDGTKWPDGNYKISVVAKDSGGESVSVTADATGVVDSVDISQSPPLITIGGQTFTVSQIKRVIRAGSTT